MAEHEPAKTAVLLIAHGSRNAEANDDLAFLADRLRSERFVAVEASFLELAEPDIREGGRRCVHAGAERVVLTPFFLSAGVHVKRDLTGWRDTLESEHPGVEFTLAAPIGRHPALKAILLDRIHEASRADDSAD